MVDPTWLEFVPRDLDAAVVSAGGFTEAACAGVLVLVTEELADCFTNCAAVVVTLTAFKAVVPFASFGARAVDVVVLGVDGFAAARVPAAANAAMDALTSHCGGRGVDNADWTAARREGTLEGVAVVGVLVVPEADAGRVADVDDGAVVLAAAGAATEDWVVAVDDVREVAGLAVVDALAGDAACAGVGRDGGLACTGVFSTTGAFVVGTDVAGPVVAAAWNARNESLAADRGLGAGAAPLPVAAVEPSAPGCGLITGPFPCAGPVVAAVLTLFVLAWPDTADDGLASSFDAVVVAFPCSCRATTLLSARSRSSASPLSMSSSSLSDCALDTDADADGSRSRRRRLATSALLSSSSCG